MDATINPVTGEILWKSDCYDCQMEPAHPNSNCIGKNPGEEC